MAILVFIIILFAAGLIFIPITYRIEGRYNGEFSLNGRIRFFGFLPINTIIANDNVYLKFSSIKIKVKKLQSIDTYINKENRVQKSRSKTKKNNRKVNFHEILALVKQVSPSGIELSGRYGFDDPGTTGMISGLIYSLYGTYLPIKFNLEPVFVQQIFDIKLKAHGDIKVFKLLKIVI